MRIVRTRRRGVTRYVPSRAYNGYALFAPLFGFGRDIWLIDMQGRIVNRWNTEPYGPTFARLLPNGNLLYLGVKPGGTKGPVLGDLFGEKYEPKNEEERGAYLIEVDWDNNLIWKYEAPYYNHDFNRMENGNTIYIKFITVPQDIAAKVKGGIPGTESNGVMWADGLEEVTPEGKVVWEWRAYEHLDPEKDAICPHERRVEWCHMNTCTVLPDGNILGSFRHTNIICFIDKATGDIIWRWGVRELGHQHEPTMLNNGNILVYDNGVHRFFSQDLDYYSRILEVNPTTNEIEWEYKADPPSDFYSLGMGSAQRLPNGNTFICESLPGRLFEITPDGEIVWEYISPFYGQFLVYGQCSLIYRAYRYGSDYGGLKGKNLDPGKFKWINGVYGPGI